MVTESAVLAECLHLRPNLVDDHHNVHLYEHSMYMMLADTVPDSSAGCSVMAIWAR